MIAAGLIHQHGVAVMHLASQQHARQLIADLGLHQATQLSLIHISEPTRRS